MQHQMNLVSLGTTSGGGPNAKKPMGDTNAQTRVESLGDTESLGEDASKQGKINAIDADEDITLVNDQDDADISNYKVSAATTTTTATIPTPRKGIVITELVWGRIVRIKSLLNDVSITAALIDVNAAQSKGEEEKSDKDDVATGDSIEKTNGLDTEMPVKEAETENGAENRIKNEPNKRDKKEEGVEAPSSQPVEYYLKHKINEKLIEALVDNHRFNDSMSRVRVGKVKGKTYTLSPRGPVYEAILKKKITRKEDIEGNFEIPCNMGGLKCMNTLVDQGSDVNVMHLSTYMKLTNERPAETDIRLSLASHSYIYPLGIAEDVLFDVAGFVYPVDFVNLDIKEDEKRPFILRTPFLTTAKAVIKFDKGTITLRSGKSKISFYRIIETLCKVEKVIKNNIRPIAPTMTVNRLVLEWEETIKLHREKEMKFN
ncbi:zinc finger, CCHC-type containing protein [Tanacetum coccineum]